MYVEVALIAYIVDRVVGEFGFIRHPVVWMGDLIGWYEQQWYRDSVWRGVGLVIVVVGATWLISLVLQTWVSGWGRPTEVPMVHPDLQVVVLGIFASMAIASKMLYDSVAHVIDDPASIRYLVSRDTEALTPSDIHKAAIETYAENLSDGVIAPLLYLILFGLPGAFAYKAINTLDSMVGYRNPRYEHFGKAAARLDDIANYIPARITAIIIMLLTPSTIHYPPSTKLLTTLRRQASKHPSPNAGYPITAMALSLGIKLGGPTPYDGQIKPKAWFGTGRETITADDIRRALRLQPRLDIFVIIVLMIGALV